MRGRYLSTIAVVILALCACSTDGGTGDGHRPSAPPAVEPTTTPAKKAPASSPTPAATSSLPRLQGAHHPVFDFKANRLLAHTIRDKTGLAIPVGHPGVAKYLHFRRPWLPWKLGQRVDDRQVALASRNTVWLSFPLTATQAKASKLALRLVSPVVQGMRVKVNTVALPQIKLSKGWQRVVVDLPGKALVAGENRVQIKLARRGRLGRARGSWRCPRPGSRIR